jgi:glycosyltransferase involved in cell wall biosynthesis
MAGVGGMVSFQHKLAAGLAKRGVEACFDLDDLPYEAVLVTGGTRQLAGLRRARQRGARIVQRLDGMNWLHRRRRTGLHHFLRAEWGNWLLNFIRSHLADEIVYQSGFSRRWWERARGQAPVSSRIVYNGVDLDVYSPLGRQDPPPGPYRLLLVEAA